MPYYKDINNKVHFLEDASFEWLLSSGCIAITSEEAEELQQQPSLSKPERIAVLQTAYEFDRDKFHRAWLSTLIADGVEETVRQAAIQAQMNDLDAQLEANILAILMEE